MGEGVGEPEPPQENALQVCLLRRLPPPEKVSVQWKVSGYALVDAYIKCHDAPGKATATGFRSAMREIAHLDEDASWVLLIAPSRDAP